jgi:Secretion system C-terminal sorting domain
VQDGATYEIYGIDGRSWVTKSKTSGAIDVSQLLAGTYILKISESERTNSRKFVKE